MKLKIKKHEYEITPTDEFMDNGACVQLLTQSKEASVWGCRPTPVLSKKAIKEIAAFNRIQKEHKYGPTVTIFALDV